MSDSLAEQWALQFASFDADDTELAMYQVLIELRPYIAGRMPTGEFPPVVMRGIESATRLLDGRSYWDWGGRHE